MSGQLRLIRTRKDLAMYPDRLTAIASEAFNRGATAATHNLGALHAAIHHADFHTAPARLPDEIWQHHLDRHRTA
ncbi:hypothetical protein A3K89_22275 [Rhodococcoides kyotonense]|uniref:Uncharacterized protein n=2 Tax=Rhodococcoides kyotonense TaxID=398843 RepID=A0A177YEC7_9NOCA|nr:hypothetical protein A3K89_22275 [Rhodococcus kyotonensis]